MPNCSILGCKNSTNNGTLNGTLSFHRFPRNPNIKEKWIKATGHRHWYPTKYSLICSSHFKKSCFSESNKLRRLIQNSIPTINILTRTNIYEKPTQHMTTVEEGSTQLQCAGPSQPSTSNTAYLDASCEVEDNTQLTSFENPYLPGTKYPGLDYSSDSSDEKCDEIKENIKTNTAEELVEMSCVKIKKEIEDIDNTQATSCEDPSQLDTGTSYHSSSDTVCKKEIKNEAMKIEVEEITPNVTAQYIDNQLDDLMRTRDNCFEKFGEYVVTMLNRMPLQKAFDLQPQIVHLITSAMNDCEDSSQTSQIKTEDERYGEEN